MSYKTKFGVADPNNHLRVGKITRYILGKVLSTKKIIRINKAIEIWWIRNQCAHHIAPSILQQQLDKDIASILKGQRNEN